MRILLTNDDGIDAEGLQSLYDVLSRKDECMVVAPDQGRSCCSHAVTTHTSLDILTRKKNQWAVSGTPADCIRVGVLWLELKPDLVISGVNHGGNLGVDILYSGTAAGAREGSFLGIPSIAFSQYMRRDVERDWAISATRAYFVFENILSRQRVGPGFWNVNLPALPSRSADLDFPISICEPEQQPMPFSFQEKGEIEENGLETGKNVEMTQLRTVQYVGNYQARPRKIGSDVDLCFNGHATVSWIQSERAGEAI